jgi:hypothetical protein
VKADHERAVMIGGGGDVDRKVMIDGMGAYVGLPAGDRGVREP